MVSRMQQGQPLCTHDVVGGFQMLTQIKSGVEQAVGESKAMNLGEMIGEGN